MFSIIFCTTLLGALLGYHFPEARVVFTLYVLALWTGGFVIHFIKVKFKKGGIRR